MANLQESNKKQDFPQFCSVDEATIKQLLQTLGMYLDKNALQFLGLESADGLYWDRDAIFEMLNRVEMRRIYFHVFHKGMEMGELNEGCLFCFWIQTYAVPT